MMSKTRYEYLVQGFLDRTLSDEEVREYLAAEHGEVLEERMGAALKAGTYQGESTAVEARRVFGAVINSIYTTRTVHRVHFMRRWWAAASVTILLLAGAYFYTTSKKTGPDLVKNTLPTAADVLPGGNKAVLTLSDGTTITLDSAVNGEIAKQGSASIYKTSSGEISYETKGIAGGEVMMNTMRTPNGGQYQLKLPDGTKVWLNAASSITYPTVFIGNKREVSITGEAYFEVARDPSAPFIVKTASEPITVLGTSFNVNSYPDEGAAKTTLLEGSIRIHNTVLKPGQAYRDGKIVQTDPGQDIAWKNGVFDFNNVSLAGVARQLSRWYDIEFSYPANLAGRKFGGQVGRNFTLTEVLELIDEVDMKFTLAGRKVIVTP